MSYDEPGYEPDDEPTGRDNRGLLQQYFGAAQTPVNTIIVAGRDGALGVVAGLAAAQAEFLPIVKTKTATVYGENKKGERIEYRYDYADIADVLAEVRPKLATHGVAVIQTPEVGPNATYLVTLLAHEDGSYIRGDIQLPNWRGPQDLGSALTYYRRYTLSSLTGVASETDDDGQRAQQRSRAGERRESYQQRASRERAERAPQHDAETYEQWRTWLNGAMSDATAEQADEIDHFLQRTGTDINDQNLSRARRDAVRREVERLIPAPFEQPDYDEPAPAGDTPVEDTQPEPPQPDPRIAEIAAQLAEWSQEQVTAALIERELPRNGNLATKRMRLATAMLQEQQAADRSDEPDGE